MSDNKTLGKKIIEAAGGAQNIKSITNCATRLRMYIKDVSKYDEESIKKIDGVMGTSIVGDQYQVIVGPKAIHLCKAIQDAYGIAGAGKKPEKAKGNIVNRFLETVSGCIAPLVPALAASGLIKVLLTICSMLNLLPEQSQTYALLSTASDAVFYFMPVILAYTSAKRFQCNEVLAIVIAGVLLHPNFVSMVTQTQEQHMAIHFLGLPVTQTSYNGTVVPIILTVWVMSYIEKFIDKILPEVVVHLFRPLLIVLFMTPIALIVTGPAGAIFGQGLAVVLQTIFAKAGWVALALTLLVTSFLCMTGMHLALIPVAMTSIAEVGYDEFVLVVFLCFTLSQGAAALAVLLKTKNSKLRQLAIPAAISGLFGGTSEPALYGISVKMKKPLYATIIGSTVAGIYAGIVHLKVFAFGLFSVVGIPGYYSAKYSSNLQHAIITAVLTIGVTMIAVWILGFDDSVYDDYDEESAEDVDTAPIVLNENVDDSEVVSVTSGKIVKQEDIKDEVFSTGVIAKTVGIVSNDGVCYSPVDGEIASVFQTKHAMAFKSKEGTEVLMHVGIDSVNLEGEGFKVFVEEGDTVKKGQKVLTYDKTVFEKNNIDETTIMAISNTQDYEDIQMLAKGEEIIAGDPIFATLAKED